MFATKQKKRYISCILAVIFSLQTAGCTLRPVEELPKETTPHTEESQIPETEPDLPETSVTEPEQMPGVNVLSNSGKLAIHEVTLPVTKRRYPDPIRYDDRHMLYITYSDSEKDENGEYHHVGVHFYMIDTLEGRIVDETDFPDRFTYFNVDYTDDGLVLFTTKVNDEGSKVTGAYSVVFGNERLTVQSVHRETVYPNHWVRLVSPTEEYVVYATMEDGWGCGGIDVRYGDGSVSRILQTVTLQEAKSLSGVTGYTPRCFVDDTHLLYTIEGYEHIKGFGIYDLATGENVKFDDGKYAFCIAKDGVIYFEEITRTNEGYPEQYRIWSMPLGGEKTLLASIDETDDVKELPPNMSFRDGDLFLTFTENSSREEEENLDSSCAYVIESIYSPDMAEKLAVIEYPSNRFQSAIRNIHFYGNSVTIVLPVASAVE